MISQKEIEEYTSNDVNIIKTFSYKKELCSDIFDENDKMRQDIRIKLLDISDLFINFLGIDFFVHDIVLMGSLANYNWSKYSDVDLHIIVDFENYEYSNEFLKEFFDSKKTIWNDKHDIKIKDFDVELYVQDIEDEFYSSGVYSILNNEWLEKPEMINPKIEDSKILTKADEYGNKIDKLYNDFRNGINIENKVYLLYKKLKNFRKFGLSKNGENSYENLTFKLLRRNGYIKKLLDLKNMIIDKNLSIS
jgi:predicted nucleotidyltransferase